MAKNLSSFQSHQPPELPRTLCNETTEEILSIYIQHAAWMKIDAENLSVALFCRFIGNFARVIKLLMSAIQLTGFKIVNRA